MCKFLHQDHKVIKENGTGWKLFGIDKYKNLYSLVEKYPYLQKSFENDTIEWGAYPQFSTEGDGFCFFRLKRDAIRAQKFAEMWIDNEVCCGVVLRKIKYWFGLGEQLDDSFVPGKVFKTAVCKHFSYPIEERHPVTTEMIKR